MALLLSVILAFATPALAHDQARCSEGYIETDQDIRNHDAVLHSVANMQECSHQCTMSESCDSFEFNTHAGEHNCWTSSSGYDASVKQHVHWISCLKASMSPPLDVPVVIQSHRNHYLQDNDGQVGLSETALAGDQWTIHRVSNGKLVIKSHRSQNLQDSYGQVSLSENALAWEQWTIRPAGNDKFVIMSHRNENLQDDHGRIGLSANALAWEQWRILPVQAPTTDATTTISDTITAIIDTTAAGATDQARCSEGYSETDQDIKNHNAVLHSVASMQECSHRCTTSESCDSFEFNPHAGEHNCWTSSSGHDASVKQHVHWISCLKAWMSPPLGVPVFIQSHRNHNLQDNDGQVIMSETTLARDQWTIHRASNGKFVIKSHRSQNLQDNYGQVSLSENALAWEQWTIRPAGNDKFVIMSHRNENLQDDHGQVGLSANALAWEQWRILPVQAPTTDMSTTVTDSTTTITDTSTVIRATDTTTASTSTTSALSSTSTTGGRGDGRRLDSKTVMV